MFGACVVFLGGFLLGYLVVLECWVWIQVVWFGGDFGSRVAGFGVFGVGVFGVAFGFVVV